MIYNIQCISSFTEYEENFQEGIIKISINLK